MQLTRHKFVVRRGAGKELVHKRVLRVLSSVDGSSNGFDGRAPGVDGDSGTFSWMAARSAAVSSAA